MKSAARTLLRRTASHGSEWQAPALAERGEQAARHAARRAADPGAPAEARSSDERLHAMGPLAEPAPRLGALALAHGRDVAPAPGEARASTFVVPPGAPAPRSLMDNAALLEPTALHGAVVVDSSNPSKRHAGKKGER